MTRYQSILPTLLSILALRVNAQDPGDQVPYPTWVTNDYNCVIKCIADQLGSATPPATVDQKAAALGCVRDACSKDTAAGNSFQAFYIINMFDVTGSIYEPESWQQGNAPDASELKAPDGWVATPQTSIWTDDSGQAQTTTTTAWIPPTANAGGEGGPQGEVNAAVLPATTGTPDSVASALSGSGSGALSASSTDSGNMTSSSTDLSRASLTVGFEAGVTVLLGLTTALGLLAVGGVAAVAV